jgi:lysosomal alpha-mannosidase
MGGWVHTDECNANFEDIIANFIKGHQWLSKEFGISPRIGWNIDAFGHTQANAALFHDLGFEALFFARAQSDDVNWRFDNQQSHFLWRPLSKHFGAQKEILGGILAHESSYAFAKGFKVDEHFDECGPIQNDPTLADYNGDLKVAEMVNYIHMQANGTASDENVMVMMGDDFTHANAYFNYHELDQIIDMVNKEGDKYNLSLVASTPG